MRQLGGNARVIDEATIGVENGDGQFVWPIAVEDELAKLYRGDDALYLEVNYRREHSPSQAGNHFFSVEIFNQEHSLKSKARLRHHLNSETLTPQTHLLNFQC
ncbi:hypothetical protein ACFX19_031298 [Malus domestica]